MKNNNITLLVMSVIILVAFAHGAMIHIRESGNTDVPKRAVTGGEPESKPTEGAGNKTTFLDAGGPKIVNVPLPEELEKTEEKPLPNRITPEDISVVRNEAPQVPVTGTVSLLFVTPEKPNTPAKCGVYRLNGGEVSFASCEPPCGENKIVADRSATLTSYRINEKYVVAHEVQLRDFQKRVLVGMDIPCDDEATVIICNSKYGADLLRRGLCP